jgi:hypothetical protein
MAATKRVGRPMTAPKPGQKSVLDLGELKIPAGPDLKTRLIEACRVSTRSLASEMQFRLERSFDRDDRNGGAGETAFVDAIAQVTMAKCGPGWVRSPYGLFSFDGAARAMVGALRPRFNRAEWFVALFQSGMEIYERTLRPVDLAMARADLDASYAAGSMGSAALDETRDQMRQNLERTEANLAAMQADFGKRDEYRSLLDQAGYSEMLQHRLDRQWTAADPKTDPKPARRSRRGARAAPTPEPAAVTVEQKIAAGRDIVALLAVENDPERRQQHRDRLAAMAQLVDLPPEVCAEFAAAAQSSVVPYRSSSPAAGPAPDEWRPRSVLLFDACWQLARVRASEHETNPSEKGIAEAFAAEADPSLFTIAEMHDIPQTAEAVLRYRDQIEERRTQARGSAAPASDLTPRRRARRMPAG